jgi:hypothetical protein
MKKQHFISLFLAFPLLTLIQYPCFAADDIILFSGTNVLAGANHNSGTGSSDMTLIMKLEGDGEAFVDEGHEVKYIIPDEDIDGWFEPEFDDSDWEDGISGVGYGDTDDNTVVRGGIWSVYTRYTFQVEDAFKVEDLMFYVDYDDGYVAWLNGVEIWRSGGMLGRGDPPPWNASSGGHGSTEQAKGNPNPNRWNAGGIEKKQIDFEAKLGDIAVEPIDKLAVTWGNIKAKH